jgi:hypothetical protein
MRNAAVASIAGVLLAAAGAPEVNATAQPADQHVRRYVDSSRSGVLEFLDVGQAGRIRFERYLNDYSFCSGVRHLVETRTSSARRDVIVLSGGGTIRVLPGELRVSERGARGAHRFHRLNAQAEQVRLIQTFLRREAALRRSLHFKLGSVGANTHCKR